MERNNKVATENAHLSATAIKMRNSPTNSTVVQTPSLEKRIRSVI
jgi:hypothetical protein